MNTATLNNRRLRSTLITLAALLALLLQVQSVFACEMMQHSGPVSECCCEEMANGQEPDCGCCALDTQVSFKAEAQDQQPALPAAQLTLELPQLAAPSQNHWPPILAPPAPARFTHTHSDPAHPGTLTYLATLRLRI